MNLVALFLAAQQCSYLISPSAVSHSYGYGLLDASGIVELARTWSNVGPQRKCVVSMVFEPRLVHSCCAHALHEISQKFRDSRVDTSNLNKIK